MKYVYLMQMTESQYFKIGVSKSPKKRIKSLQTSCPEEIVCHETFPSEFAHQIEKTLHRQIAHQGTQGEWFSLKDDFVSEFVEHCERIHNSLSSLKKMQNPYV